MVASFNISAADSTLVFPKIFCTFVSDALTHLEASDRRPIATYIRPILSHNLLICIESLSKYFRVILIACLNFSISISTYPSLTSLIAFSSSCYIYIYIINDLLLIYIIFDLTSEISCQLGIKLHEVHLSCL